MNEVERAFIEAQSRMLSSCGVVAESRFINIPLLNGQAHVLVSGQGPSVVMISGIGTPSAMWAPLMSRLTGFRVYGVDLPGYGLTDTISSFADNLRVNAVSFLLSVLDRLDLPRPAIVANSLGSLWSSWLALDHPDRVAALVHVGCPAIVLDTSAPLPMRLLSVRGLGRLMMRLQPPSHKQVIELTKMVREHPAPTELVDLLLATERLPHFKPIFLETLHRLIRLRGNRPGMRLSEDQLGQIVQPTLLFFGEDDPMGAADVGRRMAAAMPGAVLHVVEGGHAPWLTQSEKIGPLISEFVSKHLLQD